MFREGFFFIKYFVYNGGKYRHEICYSCNGSVVLEKEGVHAHPFFYADIMKEVV